MLFSFPSKKMLSAENVLLVQLAREKCREERKRASVWNAERKARIAVATGAPTNGKLRDDGWDDYDTIDKPILDRFPKCHNTGYLVDTCTCLVNVARLYRIAPSQRVCTKSAWACARLSLVAYKKQVAKEEGGSVGERNELKRQDSFKHHGGGDDAWQTLYDKVCVEAFGAEVSAKLSSPPTEVPFRLGRESWAKDFWNAAFHIWQTA